MGLLSRLWILLILFCILSDAAIAQSMRPVYKTIVGSFLPLDSGAVGPDLFCGKVQHYKADNSDPSNFIVFEGMVGDTFKFEILFSPKKLGRLNDTVTITWWYPSQRGCSTPGTATYIFSCQSVLDSGFNLIPNVYNVALSSDTSRELVAGVVHSQFRFRAQDSLSIDSVKAIASSNNFYYARLDSTSYPQSHLHLLSRDSIGVLAIDFCTNLGPGISSSCSALIYSHSSTSSFIDTTYIKFSSAPLDDQLQISTLGIHFTTMPRQAADSTIELLWNKFIDSVWVSVYPSDIFSIYRIDSSQTERKVVLRCYPNTPYSQDASGEIDLGFRQRYFNGAKGDRSTWREVTWHFDPRSVIPRNHLVGSLKIEYDTFVRGNFAPYGVFSISSNPCTIDTTRVFRSEFGMKSNSWIRFEDFSATSFGINFYAADIGNFDDSVAVYAALDGNGCPVGDATILKVHAVVLSDSIIRLFNYTTPDFDDPIEMKKVLNSWEGDHFIHLTNNIADTTTFTDFQIKTNSGVEATLEVFDDSLPISHYISLPFNEEFILRLRNYCNQYSSFDTAVISVHAHHNNRDTTLSVAIPTVWDPLSEVNVIPIGCNSWVLPNPFVKNVIVGLSTSKNEVVKLDLFDVTGRIVSSIERECNAGPNEITIDGSSLAAGSYWYVARAGEWMRSGKLMKLP